MENTIGDLKNGNSIKFSQISMINFCTLFDSNYLARGLALYESLSQTAAPFHLYIVAFNDECYAYLSEAALPNVTPIALKDFEDEELLNIKSSRSAAEYCWTCTPSVILELHHKVSTSFLHLPGC